MTNTLPTVSTERLLEISNWDNFRPGDKKEWTALDIVKKRSLKPSKHIYDVIFREEFLPAEVVHELVCRVAEKALAVANLTDPRLLSAIAAKRAWQKGSISITELQDAEKLAGQARDELGARCERWDHYANPMECAAVEAALTAINAARADNPKAELSVAIECYVRASEYIYTGQVAHVDSPDYSKIISKNRHLTLLKLLEEYIA